MCHTFPTITWNATWHGMFHTATMEMPHSLWNNATQPWNIMEQCHTAMECHGTMPHSHGMSWNNATQPIEPCRTFYTATWNMVEHSITYNGTSWNILLHMMEPHGTFHYYWRNLMELAGTCWNIVEYLYLDYQMCI